MTRFEALRGLPQLAGASDREVASLTRYADEARVPAGVLVAARGDACSEFVIVMEGALRTDGCRLGPGASTGWDAMWERSTNTATVVAESESRLLVMSHEQFRAVKAVTAAPPKIGEWNPRRFRSPLTSAS